MIKTVLITLSLTICFLSAQTMKFVKAQVVPQEEISLEQAKQIALKKVKGKIIRAKEENDDGMIKYEIIIKVKNGRYEVEIDKATGKVLEVEKEGTNNDDRLDDDDHDDDRYDD